MLMVNSLSGFNPSQYEEGRTNLLLRSQEFGTGWTALAASVTSDTTTAPDGTSTADTITENTGAGRHGMANLVLSLTPGARYTFSVFLKQNTKQYAQVLGADGNKYGVIVDLANGSVTATRSAGSPNGTHSVRAYSNGWYRVAVTLNIADNAIYGQVMLSDSATPASYSFDSPSYTGTSQSIYAWGAQVERADFPTSYIATTSAAVSRAARIRPWAAL